MTETSPETAKALKDDFSRLDAELLSALNGIGRSKGTQKEIIEIRRQLLRARAKCEGAGIEAESLWEFAEKRRVVNEAYIRKFVQQHADYRSPVSRGWRDNFTYGLSILAAAFVAFMFPSIGGYVGAVFVLLFAVGVIEDIFLFLFPSTGVKAGKMSYELGIYVDDLFPKGSDDLKDYSLAWDKYEMRDRMNGKRWLRAR